MLLDENRNCNHGCNCNNSQNFSSPTSSDATINSSNYSCNCDCDCGNENTTLATNISNCCDCETTRVVNCDARRKMMEDIRCLDFAITELALYLDTHPDDQKALCLHRKYCKEVKDLKDKYQKVFGPLTINFPCNKWRWLEEPWPWERGNF